MSAKEKRNLLAVIGFALMAAAWHSVFLAVVCAAILLYWFLAETINCLRG